MVDFQDPVVILNEYQAFVKLCHALGGLYIWEFLTTLDYEWNVIQGRRHYRWTIWIYSFTRVATLMAVILNLIGLNVTRPINCQVWVTFNFVFGYLALSSSLLLIVLRIIAIWNKNRAVIVLGTCVWGIYLAFFIQGISQLRSEWLPGFDTCMLPNMERDKLAFIITFAIDLTLVLTMFLGLLRLRGRGGGMFGLARLLWKQGVIWLLFATGTGLITVVFICLDLNPLLNIMFLIPTLISMSITATRLYTSLADFSSSADIVVDSDLERGRSTNPNTKRMPVVHVAREQFPTSQSATLSLDMSEQLRDKPQGLSFNNSLESGVGK